MTHIPSLVLIAALYVGMSAVAHPPDELGRHQDEPAFADKGTRDWTNIRTGRVVRGTFLAAQFETVSIEREGGGVEILPLNDLAPEDRAEAERRTAETLAINEHGVAAAFWSVSQAQSGEQPGKADKGPAQATPFAFFAPFVRTRWDDRWLYVESDGMPHAPAEHTLMVGIKSWQQQVPLPQDYTGANAWQIPLKPELAEKPVSGKTELRRGAVALAANGVPIFNALNNRGDDAFKFGELDEFGGHSGRADDYHYHVAPLQLQKIVGKDNPIAYALDGFAVYGLFDPVAKPGQDGSCPLGGAEVLDELNGHFGARVNGGSGTYHYHASKAYPYINGGMRGKVTVKEDQVDPQPHANPIREAGRPLRGASITGFRNAGDKAWSLEYVLGDKKYGLSYRIEKDGKYTFEFVEPNGEKKTETYTKREGEGGRPRRGAEPRNGDPPPPPRDGQEPPRRDEKLQQKDKKVAVPQPAANGLELTSPAVGADGKLPAEFTCDGASLSPPLVWNKAPAETKSFAITMHHIPGPSRPNDRGVAEDKHVYLVLYNIPASTLRLEKGATTVGVRGINTVNRRTEYAPPCSKGPGAKTYTLTVYALSSEPAITIPSNQVTMDVLLSAIKDRTLATSTLHTSGQGRRAIHRLGARFPGRIEINYRVD
ncbi:MAG: YHYH protein [Planctomycetes bacterium]|nr:YHYH protein [Planctomycetota bacterium]